jgi:hypothetical protein
VNSVNDLCTVSTPVSCSTYSATILTTPKRNPYSDKNDIKNNKFQKITTPTNKLKSPRRVKSEYNIGKNNNTSYSYKPPYLPSETTRSSSKALFREISQMKIDTADYLPENLKFKNLYNKI